MQGSDVTIMCAMKLGLKAIKSYVACMPKERMDENKSLRSVIMRVIKLDPWYLHKPLTTTLKYLYPYLHVHELHVSCCTAHSVL